MAAEPVLDHSRSGRGADREARRHAIIGATLVTAAVLADVGSAKAGGYLLIVFLPLWLALTGLLDRR